MAIQVNTTGSFLTVGVFILIISSFCPAKTQDSKAKPLFRHFNQEDGLSYDKATCIVQDQIGYIWIGTEDGLNRFDGYSFQVFRQNSGHQGLRGSDIKSLKVDQKGVLWIGTANGGLSSYQSETDQFTHYPLKQGRSVGNYFVRDIIVANPYGIVAVGSRGLYFLDKGEDSLTQIGFPNAETGNIHEVQVFQDSLLFIAAQKGAFKYTLRSGRAECISLQPGNPVHQISKFSEHELLIYSQPTGFHLFNNKFNSWKKIVSDYTQWKSNISVQMDQFGDTLLISNAEGAFQYAVKNDSLILQKVWYQGRKIGGVVKDWAGNFWLKTPDQDVSFIIYSPDKDTAQVFYTLNEEKSRFAPSSNSIINFFVDRDSVMWAATGNRGISVINLKVQPFGHVKTQPHSQGKDDMVFSLHMSTPEQLWIGGNGHVSVLNEGNKVEQIVKFENDILGYQLPGAIFQDGRQLWIGFMDGQLARFDLDKSKLYHYRYNEPKPFHFTGWTIRSLLKIKSKLFIGSFSGLYIYDEVKEEFELFPGSGSSLREGRIFCLKKGEANFVWIGTMNDGLIRLDIESLELKSFTKNLKPVGLAINYVRAILIDRFNPDQLWLATDLGLGLFSTKFETFEPVDLKFPGFVPVINSLEQDSKGQIWAGTNEGLILYNPGTNSTLFYDKRDGLAMNSFNIGASVLHPDGHIYLGGNNGLVSLSPSQIHNETKVNQVIVKGLRVFNQEITVGREINGQTILQSNIVHTKNLKLSHLNNDFSLEFSALNFINPKKIRYRYRLSGYERKWKESPYNQRWATYTNLPPGQYPFEVQARQLDGTWPDHFTKQIITVMPAWYQAIWFRVGFSVLTIVLIVVFFRLRTWRIRHQKKILIRHVQQRTQELKQVNDQLQLKQAEVILQNEEIQSQKDNLEFQVNNLRILGDTVKEVTAQIRSEAIIEKLYAKVNELMDAPSFSIGQVDLENQGVEYLGYTHPESGLDSVKNSLDDDSKLSVWCLKNNQEVFLNDVEKQIGKYLGKKIQGYTQGYSPKSLIYIPIINPLQNVKAILVVKSYKTNAYTQSHLFMLRNLATYIAIALENAAAYKQIEKQSEALRQLDDLKTRFFTNVSHEFRTPLCLVLGPIDHLIQSAANKEQIKMAKTIKRNGEKLLRLVSQVLDYAKLKDGQLQSFKENFDLISVISRVLKDFEYVAAAKGIRLFFESNVSCANVSMDMERMEQVFYNLLSNALKHAYKKVKLSLEVKENLEITIWDDGKGVSPPDRERIFDRYYQADDSEASHGTGIGLYLVQKFTESNGGKVYVDSQYKTEQSYTAFHLRFEVDTLECRFEKHSWKSQRPLNREYGKTGQDKPLIMLVEDDVELREYLVESLEKKYQVITAQNGEEALELMKDAEPKLIISDVMMPKMDGVALTQHIKQSEAYGHIPVILLTAQAEERNEIRGIVTGADDYLKKPFRQTVLLAKVGNLIRQREQLRAKFSGSIIEEVLQLAQTRSDKAFLSKALGLVEKNLDNADFKNTTLIQEMGMNKTTAYTRIKILTGKSISEFIRHIRLQHAKNYLVLEQLSLSEISYKVGFKSLSQFSREFKKEFGQAPSRFQEE